MSELPQEILEMALSPVLGFDIVKVGDRRKVMMEKLSFQVRVRTVEIAGH
jgi:hypothetical protein